MRTIRAKITLITILVILTSVISISGATHLIIQNETNKSSVETMNLINESTEKLLENYFESVQNSSEIVGNVAVDGLDSVFLMENGAGKLNSQTPEQRQALDDYLRDYCATMQTVFAGVAENTEGLISYYYCIDPNFCEDVHGFFYMKRGKAGLVEQPPLNVWDLTPNEILGATWYDTAVSIGVPTWIGSYVCQGEWVLSYMVPIYKASMLVGVLGVDISCDYLVDELKDLRLYNTGYVCLMDETGRVIYHPEVPTGNFIDEFAETLSGKVLKTNNSGDELIRYTLGGQEKQLSFSTLSNGLKLSCVVPVKEVNATWSKLLSTTASITVFFALVYIVVIFLVVGAITNPLKQLTDASRRLADSDYDVNLSYDKKDEIGVLTGAFSTMRDHIRQNVRDLNHQLYYDKLTDLPNMRNFLHLAGGEQERFRAEGKEAAMVYINLIGTRNYNRQYGFEKGDELIVNFAGILSRNFGDAKVCRYSGDQFTAVADADKVDEILAGVLRECATAMDGKPLPIRVGVYPGHLGYTDINIACDRAKYASDLKKGEQSSSITYYTEEMLKQTEVELHVIHNLDRALEEGWIKVYYQPIVRSADGTLCDEEALSRWIDPELGFLSPAYFIPALEQSKMIYKLDLYVVDEVLKKMNRQKAAGITPVSQSINLSRMDFEMCDIVEEIRRRVDDAGIERSMISVEITESVIGSDFEFMKAQVARFQSLGFPVWMDDFGSGYSSLDVLHQIHFSLLKFDMRFMDRFNEGNDGKVILTHMINMAQSLGVDTLCEGVEEAEQVEFLRQAGCGRIQGYYFGKPKPYEEM
jgi:diguanylate cyclase (GGDEF)-like protein